MLCREIVDGYDGCVLVTGCQTDRGIISLSLLTGTGRFYVAMRGHVQFVPTRSYITAKEWYKELVDAVVP